jgi:hypothetical protein
MGVAVNHQAVSNGTLRKSTESATRLSCHYRQTNCWFPRDHKDEVFVMCSAKRPTGRREYRSESALADLEKDNS